MNILYFTYPLNGLLMVALPIALGIFLARRLGARWGLFGVGMVTFVASQVVHIPVNMGLTQLFAQGILPQPPEAWSAWFNPVVLGLTAGLSEETARYVVYRVWIKQARSWAEALMFGAGHGGIEAMLLGISVLVSYVVLFAIQRLGVDALGLPPEQQTTLMQQVADYWSAAWPLSLLGAVERVFSLCVHVALAVVVLQAVKRRNLLWLAGAVLFHAASNTVALLVLQPWGPYVTEAVIGVFALAALAIIYLLREEPPAPAPPPSAPVVPAPVEPAQRPAPPSDDPLADLRRKLEDTRYE